MRKISDTKALRATITPETEIIDIISQYRDTEKIFKRLEKETGACICCQALFFPLGEAAKKIGFDLESAIMDILAVIKRH